MPAGLLLDFELNGERICSQRTSYSCIGVSILRVDECLLPGCLHNGALCLFFMQSHRDWEHSGEQSQSWRHRQDTGVSGNLESFGVCP